MTLCGLLAIARVMYLRPVVLVVDDVEPVLVGAPGKSRPKYCEGCRFWETENGSAGMCHFMPKPHRTHQHHHCAQGELKYD